MRRNLVTVLLATLMLTTLAAPASAEVAHTVAPGETLWSIAAANNLTTRTVAAYNGLSEDAQVVLGSTIRVPTTAEGYAALQGAGLAPADPRRGARRAAAPAAPGGGYTVAAGRHALGHRGERRRLGRIARGGERPRPGRDPARRQHADARRRLRGGGAGGRLCSAPPAQGAYTVRAGDTLCGLAAGAGVSVADMAAMNGLDPDGVLVEGTVLKLPSGAPAPARASEPAPAPVVPRGRPGADADHGRRRRRPGGGRAVRRLPLARRRDRVAGERLQQRDGLGRQRARRDAGDAGHVGLRAGEPRRSARSTRTRRPTTCTPA